MDRLVNEIMSFDVFISLKARFPKLGHREVILKSLKLADIVTSAQKNGGHVESIEKGKRKDFPQFDQLIIPEEKFFQA